MPFLTKQLADVLLEAANLVSSSPSEATVPELLKRPPNPENILPRRVISSRWSYGAHGSFMQYFIPLYGALSLKHEAADPRVLC